MLGDEDVEMEAMKQRLKVMEEEAQKLREMQDQVEKDMKSAGKSSFMLLTFY